MNKKTAFIGHRDFLPNDINERLQFAIQNEIDLGCKYFTMGAHGNFDKLALFYCKDLREKYNDLKIELVITSFNQLKPEIQEDYFGKYYYKPYEDVSTIMYDIEEKHYKQKITISNRQMIDSCNTLICYVRPDEIGSGAKNAMNYARKKGLKIVNLYNMKY